MKRLHFVALLIVGATILGATVLREPIALAAQIVDANIIGPLDADGNIKVHEQGTPTVNAAQVGTWQVRAADNPAFQPFHASVSATEGPSGGCNGFAVPVGKRLVLEFVSASVNAEQGEQAIADFRVDKNGSTVQTYEVPLRDQAFWGGFERLVGSEDVLVYAGPTTARGDAFEVHGCFASTGVGATLRMDFSGYLVDVP
jgi:hypothetical protein